MTIIVVWNNDVRRIKIFLPLRRRISPLHLLLRFYFNKIQIFTSFMVLRRPAYKGESKVKLIKIKSISQSNLEWPWTNKIIEMCIISVEFNYEMKWERHTRHIYNLKFLCRNLGILIISVLMFSLNKWGI